MEDNENKEAINTNDFLLYYTKYRPYDSTNNYNHFGANNEDSLELSEDENDNNNTTLVNGRWSQKEHLLFIKGCLLYGNYWKKVKKYIQSRSCSQIRSHAQKYIKKLNKKYYGYKNSNKINIDINLKLSEDEIRRLVCKTKFSEKDMDDAELYLLSIFRANKERDKNGMEENEENNKEIPRYDYSNYKPQKKIKEKIFNIRKVSKEEKEKEREENNRCNNNDITENENGENDNDGEYMNYGEENMDAFNNFFHRKRRSEGKILKEDILAERVDENLLYQNEAFINRCLDSKDPKDLIKLFNYFGNDIIFKVNDIRILKKYQDYLGLEIDNSEEDNIGNSKNKELNENIYQFQANHPLNNKNQNMYPYLIDPSNSSFQFNPLYNQKLLINPTFINQY